MDKDLIDQKSSSTNQSQKTVIKEIKKEKDLVLDEKYQLFFEKKLGAGAFGEIFEGKNLQTGEIIACKVESKKARHPQLHYEARILRLLNYSKPVGIPKLMWYGTEKEYNIMLMEHLGYSLEDIFNKCNRKFSLKTVLMLGIQMLKRIEFLHSKTIIHRDIKPDNFLMGNGKNEPTVYLIDFGLAKKYKSETGHIPYKDNKQLTGTARYASINNHLGIEQSRRDDLESLGYVLVYFLKGGNLPWQGLKAKNKYEKYSKICEKKTNTSIKSLCENLPDEMYQYIYYCRTLGFEDKPDYTYLIKLFKELMLKNGYIIDNIFDWTDVKKSNEGKTILVK